ncbi:MAG TPA: ribosome silencing factor [Patescibacteria group bacterium]|nr:ribosome silencing factor [Patescibacteria group bacterium]
MKHIAPKALAKRIIKLIGDKKAEDIVLLDLKKLSSVTDYFVICSVGSDVQARVVAGAVIEGLKERAVILHVEGYESARWILIDCFDVVLHVFRPEVRSFYGLERLWGDAPREEYPNGL